MHNKSKGRQLKWFDFYETTLLMSKRGQLVVFRAIVVLFRCLLDSGQFDVLSTPPMPAAAVKSDRPLAIARSRAFVGVSQLAFRSPLIAGSGALDWVKSARLRLLGLLGGGGMREDCSSLVAS